MSEQGQSSDGSRCKSIKRSGGGVSEHLITSIEKGWRVYQAFRWWGVGTLAHDAPRPLQSLSSVPVVGCRNVRAEGATDRAESIKRSGGGVSERRLATAFTSPRVYQAFRWWGVGTWLLADPPSRVSLSSVPVVGCRNAQRLGLQVHDESIKRSGGGVSEHVNIFRHSIPRVYQAFRWWGVGTAGAPRP